MISSSKAAVVASGGPESLGWLNDILHQMWPKTCIASANIVRESVEPALADLPPPISSLRFNKIFFGDTPPKFGRIDVHTRTENSIKLNIDVTWEGEECEIELQNKLISAGVETIKFKGRLSVL